MAPTYKLVKNPALPLIKKNPIPAPLKGTTAKVTMTPAGQTYLGNRTGHPGFKGNLTPAGARAAVLGVRGVGGNKPSKAATAQDTLAQITNRYIASLQTPAQLAAQNKAWIDASLKASQAATNTAYDQQSRLLGQQEHRAHQYAMALGSLRDMSGLQAGADYTNAARNIQGLGTGLTGTVADAQQAEADQAAQQIAAATQGLGQAKGLDVAGMRNVAQYTGVTQPATNLYEEAASQAAQARLNQDVRAQQIENIAGDFRAKAGDSASERAAKLAALAATRPSLYQTAMQQAQSGSRSDMATIISALALQNQTAKVPSEIAENVAGAKATTSNAASTASNADTTTAKVTGIKNGKLIGGFYWSAPGQKTAGEIPQGWRLYSEGDPTHHVIVPKGDFYFKGAGMTDPQPIPQGWMPDPKDPSHHKIVRNPYAFAPSTTKPPGGETKAQKTERIQGLVTKWASTIDDAMTSDESPYAEDVTNPILEQAGTAKPQWVPKPGMTYAKAFADIVKRLPPELRNNPQMIANINTSLKRAGFKLPKAGAKKTTTKVKSGGTAPGGGTVRDPYAQSPA